jgi:tRNA (guanosine-2'-O-)-methyltransferase
VKDYELVTYLRTFLTDERRAKMESILSMRTRHFTVLLEDIFDPHNASAVIRSQDAFGIQDTGIIENRNFFKLNESVAMGSGKWVDITHYSHKKNNTEDAFFDLHKRGYQIAAATPHTTNLLTDLNLNQKTTFLFGSEKDGLSDYALEHADIAFRIPMYGFAESFNISVSAALVFFYARQQMKSEYLLSENERIDLELRWLMRDIRGAERIVEAYKKKLTE